MPFLSRGGLITGFLGGFTTYSSYMLDLLQLTAAGEKPAALAYFLLHTFAGFAFAFAGLALGRAIAAA